MTPGNVVHVRYAARVCVGGITKQHEIYFAYFGVRNHSHFAWVRILLAPA